MTANPLNALYQYELHGLLNGVPRTARDLTYFESPYVPHVQPILPRGSHLVTLKARNLNYAFAFIERLSYLSGVGHYPRVIVSYVKNYRNFTTQEFIDRGAYGPRMSCQFRRAYELLRDDPQTRQAIINVYNYLQDNRGDVKDVPCTLALNFHGDAKTLSLVGYMRSNDIAWGWPYDVSAFTFLLEVMAYWLRREPVSYKHVTTSLHLYDRHVKLAKDVVEADPSDVHAWLDECPPWDLLYDETWTALETFWKAEEAIRCGNSWHSYRTISKHLNWVLSYLEKYHAA